MLQVLRVRTRPFRDIFSRRDSSDSSGSSNDSTNVEKPTRPQLSKASSIVRTITLHSSTKSLDLDRRQIVVYSRDKRDDSALGLSLSSSANFTIQECLYTIFLIEQALPRPMPREKTVPTYYSILDREGWFPRPPQTFYQPTFSEILETLAKLCVHRTGGQTVAAQIAFVKPVGHARQRVVFTLCGDDLDARLTTDYLREIWNGCRRLQALYPPVAKRNGREVPYMNYAPYREAEKELLGTVVTHTIDRIKRRVMKWHNRFRGVAAQFEQMEGRSATVDLMKSFMNVLTRFLRLLYGFFEPFRTIGIPGGLHPTITLILSEMYRDVLSCLREWYPWEACSPEVRDLADHSLFTVMDNAVVRMQYSCDGFIFSKYIRKVLEPVILVKKLVEVSSEWRWRTALSAEPVFRVVEASERSVKGQTVDLRGPKHVRDMVQRVLTKEMDIEKKTGMFGKTAMDEDVGKVWKQVKGGLVRPSGARKPPKFHRLHPECELAERFCQLSTYDFRRVRSQSELDRVDYTPYESVAVSRPPCRACKTWFMAYLQRVRSSDESTFVMNSSTRQKRRRHRPLYLAFTDRWMSEPIDATQYNWIGPKLELTLDARVKEWMTNQLRLQASNRAGLLSAPAR
ncbi:hypothetical protein ABW21_db0207668 [Orbilia brochopaga]|nr:hypothetical protein ABW21_db0207668 [Drechslerella brochopaga]